MAEEKGSRFDSAGWGVWGILFFVLVGPFIYVMYRGMYSDTSPMGYIGFGVLTAALVSAIVTASVNTVIQWRLEKVRKRERSAARKKRKKRK